MQTREYYDAYWAQRRGMEASPADPVLIELLSQSTRPGDRVLDVGCGAGSSYAHWLTLKGRSYLGVDVSMNAVLASRAAGLKTEHITEDALPFDANSFDACVSTEVLEHIFLPADTAAEAFRVLRPGGTMLVTVPNAAYWRLRVDLLVLGRFSAAADNATWGKPWLDPHIRFFTTKSISRMLADAGFEDITTLGLDGAFLGHLPLLNRLRLKSSRTYGWLQSRFPSVFAYRLCVAAKKPMS